MPDYAGKIACPGVIAQYVAPETPQAASLLALLGDSAPLWADGLPARCRRLRHGLRSALRQPRRTAHASEQATGADTGCRRTDHHPAARQSPDAEGPARGLP